MRSPYLAARRRPMVGRRILSALPSMAGLITLLVLASDVDAQFISPGKLTEAHSHLKGLTKCTQCHQLRAGVIKDKCLDCHVPLRNRLADRRGLHATVEQDDCAHCHKEHFGLDFDMVRFDTTSFEHDVKTDYELTGSHVEAGCRDCHTAELVQAQDVLEFKGEHGSLERTWLGLGSSCRGCHATEEPHEGQFRQRSCDDCHQITTWEKAESFDHNDSRYRLVGKHRQAACEDCHKPIRNAQREEYIQYVRMDFDSCEDCHRDEHEGERGNDCTNCHVNAGWHRIKRSTFENDFDHSTTEFDLVGHHAEAECSTCHGKPPRRDEEVYIGFAAQTLDLTYPRPLFDDCTSCHRDYHREVFEGSRAVCDNCHNEHDWIPADYDVERHNQDSEFSLEGAHRTVPCILCHPTPDAGLEADQFTITNQECVNCHSEDDPHENQFPDESCDGCHSSQEFLIPDYDHDDTDFPLDGKHQQVPCDACHAEEIGVAGHTFVRYKPLGTECRDCHGGG